MKVEMRAVKRVKPYPDNAKKHSEEAVAKLARLIERFGFLRPIVVDSKGVIITGHRTWRAAQVLGAAEVPVHVKRDLSPAEVKAARLADNRTARDTAEDEDLLRQELGVLQAEGFDLAFTGFEDDELNAYLNGKGHGLLPGADPDDVPDLPKQPITQPGDLIHLGHHRLVCGDATDAATWDLLLDGKLGAMVWTDPPYNVDYGAKNAMLNATDGGRRIETPIESDAETEAEQHELLQGALALTWAHSAAGATWYVAGPEGPRQMPFCTVLQGLGVWRHTVVWVKDGFVLGRCDYHYRHEPLWFGWKEGAAHVWNGGRSQDTILEYPRPKRSDLHPTMKPVALVKRCIENSSKPNALVLDPFGGSGSTLIAAEDLGRRAALIELMPAYCDVIIARWEALTGQKAQRPTPVAA